MEIPDFGALLRPFIGQVPEQARPRFLALLERGAAERYRYWAGVLPEHGETLGFCAAAEDEIADRVEAMFELDPALADELTAPLPAATAAYYEVFVGMDVWDQLRVQAGAERQGARAWRSIAAGHPDEQVRAGLEACSRLEEASADRLDALITAHAS
jgi:hypothetical protein